MHEKASAKSSTIELFVAQHVWSVNYYINRFDYSVARSFSRNFYFRIKKAAKSTEYNSVKHVIIKKINMDLTMLLNIVQKRVCLC